MGTKLNNIGKSSSINTPLAKINDPEDMYLFQSDLYDAVQVLRRELDLYVYGGKCTASLVGEQLELFNDNQD